jgi:AbrB family looped-hinge helix DNA binding protein
MTDILQIDKAGRMVLPKKFRQALHLKAGDKLSLQLVGGHLVLEALQNDVELVQEGKRRVIHGWYGFDAAAAIRETREEQSERDLR